MPGVPTFSGASLFTLTHLIRGGFSVCDLCNVRAKNPNVIFAYLRNINDSFASK